MKLLRNVLRAVTWRLWRHDFVLLQGAVAKLRYRLDRLERR